VPLGFALFPIFAPIFFGQRAVEASVYDTDFDNKVGSLSVKHLHWAKFIKEHVQQQENDERDFKKSLIRFSMVAMKPTPSLLRPVLLGRIFAQTFHSSVCPPERKMEDSPSHALYLFEENLSPICQP
jgi:hypothetical protein